MAARLLLALVCVIASSTSHVNAWEGLLPNEEAIFWSGRYSELVRSNLTSEDAEPLGIDTKQVLYIEYDPDGGLIYFRDRQSSIWVANGDGSILALFCPNVVNGTNLIAVDNSDPSDGRLFYSLAYHNEIHSIGIQGCSPSKLLVKDVQRITGLALDKIERHVYFVEGGFVHAIDYDGNIIFRKRYGPNVKAGIALSRTRFGANGVNKEGAQLYVALPSELKIAIVDLSTSSMKNLTNPEFRYIRYITVHRDLIFFTAEVSFYVVNVNGTDFTELGRTHDGVSNIVIREKPAIESQSTPMAFTTVAPEPSDLTASQSWKPTIGCLKGDNGTSIKIRKQEGLEHFSLLVMDPPQGCPADLGEFHQDVTVPEACVVISPNQNRGWLARREAVARQPYRRSFGIRPSPLRRRIFGAIPSHLNSFARQDKSVKVALQLTEIKQVLGGRYFRLFSFTCSDLGSDGKVQELSTDASPKESDATASSSSYADGSFSLMVVKSQSLESQGELSSATQLKWSQDGVYLVIRHLLAKGSQHRTLIPLQCETSSTSHPDEMTVWRNRLGSECEKKRGIIGNWIMRPKRSKSDDVTYVPMFPFNFQVGERVTITCSVLECPYVSAPEKFEGKCAENYAKFAGCGGTFKGANSRKRRGVSSLVEGHGSPGRKETAPMQDGGTRVMSATFTLV